MMIIDFVVFVYVDVMIGLFEIIDYIMIDFI